MPSPQASTDSFRVAPAPTMASTIARTVRIMQTTHESGIQRWVNRHRRSPSSPTSVMRPPMAQAALRSEPGAAGCLASISAPSATTDRTAAT